MLLSQCRKLPTSLVSHGWVRVQYGGRRSWTDHLTPRAGNTIYNVSDTAKLVITNHHEKKKKKKKNVGFSVFMVSAGLYCTVGCQLASVTLSILVIFMVSCYCCCCWPRLEESVGCTGAGPNSSVPTREYLPRMAADRLIFSWSSVDCPLTSVDR